MPLSVVLVGPEPVMARDCDASIIGVLADIRNRGAVLANTSRSNANNYNGNPFASSEELVIALDGSGSGSSNPKLAVQVARNILMSKSLNLTWSKQIMEACPDLVIVGFGMWSTGWLNSFYRFKDGQIRPKVCTSTLEPSTIWGVGWCD